MGNPIQYCNTDNKGGFRKTASVCPPRGVPRGGVNENLTPVPIHGFANIVSFMSKL